MNKTLYIIFGALLASPVMAEKINKTIDADDDGDFRSANIA